MILRLILGLDMTAAVISDRRPPGVFLYQLVAHGQPAPDRVENVTRRLGEAITEMFAQKRLLKWVLLGFSVGELGG